MSEFFEDLGLLPALVDALKKEDITTPTQIQKLTIPAVLRNQDIIGQSETGTGKTLAYLLPLFQKIDVSQQVMQAIILAPTHELAIQIQRQIESLAANAEIKITGTPIIGNVNIIRQVEKLREKPHIIVGSPGRILELIGKRKITAHTVKTIVIDEADRLLDKNNLDTIKAIVKSTLKERQLLLFSATVPPTTVTIAEEIMKDPLFIKAVERATVAPTISHMYFVAEQRDKIEMLRKLLRSINPKQALVFVNKSEEIEIIAAKLKYHGFKAEGIHSSSVKVDRKKAMEDFRAGRSQILVASDVAARGLDIKGITHVFNLDMPEKPQDYLHRAGRTGRAGDEGTTVSIITQWEIPLVKEYESLYKINITAKNLYMGKITDLVSGSKIVRNSTSRTKEKRE